MKAWVIAGAFLAAAPAYAQQQVVKVDGSSTVFPITEAVAEEFQKAKKNQIKVTVGISGTGGGFKKFCRGDTDISLSTKEFQLLEVFMRRAGEVLSRYQLLEGAWDTEYEHKSNVIDVYVRYLREKVDRPFGVETIETVRGAGYRLKAAG